MNRHRRIPKTTLPSSPRARRVGVGSILAAAVGGFLVLPCPSPAAEYVTRTLETGATYAAGSLVVKFAPGYGPERAASPGIDHLDLRDASLEALARAAGVREARAVFPATPGSAEPRSDALSRWQVLAVDPAADIPALAREWETHPGVEAAGPDYLSTLDTAPNDPMYPMQWGHDNVGQLPAWCDSCGGHDGGVPVGTPGFDARVEAAWSFLGSYGDSSVMVAVIDTGVDLDHPDLDPIVGYDFDDDDPNPQDDTGHGTRCAGIACALADNGIGSAGVAPGCRVLAIRSGKKSSERAASLVFAADTGARVATMSWTLYGVNSDSVLEDALDYAAAAEVVLCSSSGNRNEAEAYLPQGHAAVLCVGGASPCGERKRTSSDPLDMPNNDYEPDPNGVSCDGEVNWGSSYGVDVQDAPDAVDLLAPVILPAPNWNDVYDGYFNGTSCASPFVAGVAALVVSAHPEWTAAQVREALVNSATDVVNVESGPGWDRYSGYGLVNAYGAVAYGGGGPVAAPETAAGASRGDLRVAGPNPFRTETTLEWSLARPGVASLTVFDAAGRRVRELAGGRFAAGTHASVWDGRDAAGSPVASGIYFTMLRTADAAVARRVVYLR